MRKIGIVIIIISSCILLQAQNRAISRVEYIEIYRETAINEMIRTGVPASIKLSQGILESDNGNSRLATRANNHFGIKCHNSWTGKGIRHDDDAKGECFRRYNSAQESWRDHSDFLLGSTRYGFLFELNPTDYKAWARGLKKAGYATNPRYAELVIKIIEDNNLQQYDQIALGKSRKDYFAADAETSRMVHKNNRVNYILAHEGDSFESIRKEMKLLSFELFRYNEIDRDDSIHTGQILYIQPKRNRAEAGLHYHIVKKGETMYDISQIYAIKLSKLYSKNLMEYGEEPAVGKKLSLRRQLRGTKVEKGRREKREAEKVRERDKIEFVF